MQCGSSNSWFEPAQLKRLCTTSTSRYVVKYRYPRQYVGILIFGKHMNALTVHILIVLEETDPTFEWALNLGGHLIWAWQTFAKIAEIKCMPNIYEIRVHSVVFPHPVGPTKR